jgi:hypothetical protein
MDVSGIWYNELNSTMELHVEGTVLRGWYITAVGDASGPYELIGYVDKDDETPTLGWVVRWQNAKKNAQSVTTWCGQAQVIDDEEVIDSMWLLVRSTAVRDSWESTMIGKDIFRRVKASDDEVRKAMIQRGLLKSE